RWAHDNLSREATPHELNILGLFSTTCSGDEEEAAGRARRYYSARGPAPTALDRPLSTKALLARWLMILDLSELQPSHLKNHFKGNYWKDFISCMKNAYPLRFTEIHIINTERLKTISLLLLHIGMYPWRRKMVYFHGGADLIDEWTKKLLSNSKWLQSEERKFYNTDLKPEIKTRTRHRSVMRTLKPNGSYDMITRTHSCKSLNRDDLDDGMYGAYRTLKITSDKFYV
ncbi:Alpha tocopherol transfer protein, partial [Operophtera brumata]